MNMKYIFFLISIFGYFGNTLQSQIPPNLPDISSIETCFPDTTGYKIITVGPVGRDYSDLQEAINNAGLGSMLLLDAGATFSGSFTLPNKPGSGWIIISSSHMSLLPKQGNRIEPNSSTGNTLYPTQKDAMPKIITTNLSGLPCFKTQNSAHHYRFVGLEITADINVLNSYGLMFLGDASANQNSLDKVPTDFIVDRCYIHGHSNATVMKSGVILNCANSAVIESHISDFHSIGYDTYAIGGTNGPGPFIIRNNYLEAAGENILFGGAAPAIPNLVPSDIEVRNNYFFKPFSWKVDHPDYAGKHWTIKNLFELKTGKRVLIDGNIMENSWADLPIGQSGYAILLTVRSENGASPQANVSDITISNNIIRRAGAGISISGHDSPSAQKSKRIKIANNLFDEINGQLYGDGNVAGPNDGIFIKIGDPEEIIISHNTVFQTGAITWAYDTISQIKITDNIFNCSLSAGGYQGIYGPGFAKGGNGPMGKFFKGITDDNKKFHKNVLIGGPASNYSNYNTLSNNYFPASTTEVNFNNFANGKNDFHDYALSIISAYKNSATDNTDIGVNFNLLQEAFNHKVSCKTTQNVTIDQFSKNISIQPNPVNHQFSLTSSVELKNATLVLVNELGQELFKKSHISEKVSKFDLELNPGVYFYILSQAGLNIANGTLIVE